MFFPPLLAAQPSDDDKRVMYVCHSTLDEVFGWIVYGDVAIAPDDDKGIMFVAHPKSTLLFTMCTDLPEPEFTLGTHSHSFC